MQIENIPLLRDGMNGVTDLFGLLSMREIFNRIKRSKNVKIAYPHTEVIFKNK